MMEAQARLTHCMSCCRCGLEHRQNEKNKWLLMIFSFAVSRFGSRVSRYHSPHLVPHTCLHRIRNVALSVYEWDTQRNNCSPEVFQNLTSPSLCRRLNLLPSVYTRRRPVVFDCPGWGRSASAPSIGPVDGTDSLDGCCAVVESYDMYASFDSSFNEKSVSRVTKMMSQLFQMGEVLSVDDEYAK